MVRFYQQSSTNRVTGETAPVRGRGKLNITVGNSETEHDVWIADIVEEGIIGLDYLMDNNCQVNLAGKLLLVGDDEVPLVGQVRPVVNGLTRIVVRRTVAVPAMSEAIIPGKLKKCGEQRTWAVLEPVANSKRNLLVARTLVDLSADDLPIRVMNLTNGYISLKKGTEIATCEHVACVRNLEHQPSKEDDSATIHKDKGGDRELPEHLVDLYRRSKTFIGEGHKTQLIELLKEFQDMFSSGPNDLGSTSITTHKIGPWDSQQISRFESLKKGPKIVAILLTFIVWRARKKQVTSLDTRLSCRIMTF